MRSEVFRPDFGQLFRDRLLEQDLHQGEVPSRQGQFVQARSGALHALVLHQAPHQLGARVFLHLADTGRGSNIAT